MIKMTNINHQNYTRSYRGICYIVRGFLETSYRSELLTDIQNRVEATRISYWLRALRILFCSQQETARSHFNKKLIMNFIDLFAGAGGFSEGFIRAGFKPVAHVEADKAACNTLKTRQAYHYLREHKQLEYYTDYLKGKLSRDELYSKVPDEVINSVIEETMSEETNASIFKRINKFQSSEKVDVIVGGPPCQAYSLVGRARCSNGMRGDPRNSLYEQYGQFLKEFEPELFVFENVMGLLSADNGSYYEQIQTYFNKTLGYEILCLPVNAQRFGVLQNRKRVIIIGSRSHDLSELKLEDDSSSGSKVSSIFSDLPEIRAGEGALKNQKYKPGKASKYLKEAHIRNDWNILTQHVARPHSDQDKKIYKKTVDAWKDNHHRLRYTDLPEGLKTHNNVSSFLDRFKVVADDLLYSHTVVAHIAKDGHYYIHPDNKQNRSISVREAARLQTFPDNYYFEGIKENQNRTAAFKQIGNAVPPLMAEKIALKLKKYLGRKK